MRVDVFDISNIENNVSDSHVDIVTDFECSKRTKFFRSI